VSSKQTQKSKAKAQLRPGSRTAAPFKKPKGSWEESKTYFPTNTVPPRSEGRPDGEANGTEGKNEHGRHTLGSRDCGQEMRVLPHFPKLIRKLRPS